MATKKKNKKKSKKPRKGSGKKSTPAKKPARKRTASKKPAKRAASKASAKRKGSKKMSGRKTASVRYSPTPKRNQLDASGFPADASESRSGEQSGDLQGLSNVESADSQSVDELMEEGNAFEAEVVTGVEEAGRRRDREVHTREVPEDDVPGEYLDED
jgi:hypothetical protein